MGHTIGINAIYYASICIPIDTLSFIIAIKIPCQIKGASGITCFTVGHIGFRLHA